LAPTSELSSRAACRCSRPAASLTGIRWGNSRGGTAFDDRAELVRRFPAREADEYRMCAIECILEGRALAQVSATYISMVDGQDVTITHGIHTAASQLRCEPPLTFAFGLNEWITEAVCEPHGYANCVNRVAIGTNKSRVGNQGQQRRMTFRCRHGNDNHRLYGEWQPHPHGPMFECEVTAGGLDGVVPWFLVGRAGQLIDQLGFYCDKKPIERLTKMFTPADFARLPQRVQRQVVSLYSICLPANGSKHDFPSFALPIVTGYAFPHLTAPHEPPEPVIPPARNPNTPPPPAAAAGLGNYPPFFYDEGEDDDDEEEEEEEEEDDWEDDMDIE